mgnify:CR=1 FL=1
MVIRWKPNVTVAAVIERDGLFLLVEEQTADGLRLNNPAGPLDSGETLEETTFGFRPEALVGVYLTGPTLQTSDGKATEGEGITYLRFAFRGVLGAADAGRSLDHGIVRTLWMSAQEIRASQSRHRSPLLLQCVEDYLAGRRFPLELVRTAFPGVSLS